jgi:hypothetical protein
MHLSFDQLDVYMIALALTAAWPGGIYIVPDSGLGQGFGPDPGLRDRVDDWSSVERMVGPVGHV